MRVALLFCFASSVAAADDDRQFCVEKWPKLSEAKAQVDMERCGEWFAAASLGDAWVWQLSRAQCLDLQSRFMDCQSECCSTKCQPSKPAFFKIQAAAHAHFTLTDPITETSIEPTLQKLLAGQPITAKDVEGVASVTLWKFRNAPYARHGRPFKTVDLESFFYAAKADKNDMRGDTALLPVKKNPKFKDAMLDKVDRANVAVVMAAIKKRGE